jgi:hypothetical protein
MQKIVSGKLIATSLEGERDHLGIDVAGQGNEIIRAIIRRPFFQECNIFDDFRVLRPHWIASLFRELRRQYPLCVFKPAAVSTVCTEFAGLARNCVGFQSSSWTFFSAWAANFGVEK